MTMPNPERGEIWLVDFNPSAGAEIQKQRPALVVSSSAVGCLPLRIVVPFTSWQPRYEDFPWMTKVSPSKENGIHNDSAADCFQVKSVSTTRFIRLIGHLAPHLLDNIVDTIAVVINAI